MIAGAATALLLGACSSGNDVGVDPRMTGSGDVRDLALTQRPSSTDAASHDGDVASVCFNAGLLESGTTLSISYRSNSGETRQDEALVVQVGGRSRYDTNSSNDATAVRTDVEKTIADESGTSYTEYLDSFDDQDTGAMRVFHFVDRRESARDGYELVIERQFDPHRERRFDLTAGETFSQSYQREVTATASGFGDQQNAGSGTNDSTVLVDETVEFVGVESIAIEGGTFEACRFEVAVSERELLGKDALGRPTYSDPKEYTRLEWYGVESGVLLWDYTSASTQVQLLSGDV